MLKVGDKEIDEIHITDSNNKHREIAYVYKKGKMIWELIIGFLFSSNGYSLQSKDGFILKAKDQ